MIRALAVVVMLAGAAPALAANADHPDQNVDKSLDKGGDTGNSKVDALNRAQLDENQKPAPSSQTALASSQSTTAASGQSTPPASAAPGQTAPSR